MKSFAHRCIVTKLAFPICCGMAFLFPAIPAHANSTAAALRSIAQTYASEAVRTGNSVGVEVGVVYADRPPLFVSAGDAVHGQHGSRPFNANTIFQIGSVSKIFTTNLLGQAVAAQTLYLNEPLSDFAPQIGAMQPLTSQVTLEELADFTGGFPSLAPLCDGTNSPGCLPNSRPPIDVYTAQQFADFFDSTVPADYNANPATALSSLPGPYFYSDYSIGLIGLLLGDSTGDPLTNSALTGWFDETTAQLLQPLKMNHTYLFGAPAALSAAGYESALATATVTNGQISAINLVSPGGMYQTAPTVRIVGGGGHGAVVTAAIDANQRVDSFTIVKPGSGYIAPASVTFTNGQSSKIADAAVIVKNGRVVAVNVISPGAGYQQTPTVTISGGRKASGRDAQAVAEIANGQVTHLSITDDGAGYVPRLAIQIAPGAPVDNAIPIWAAAGALSSSMRDMVSLAAAALQHTKIGRIEAPAPITDGFQIAEQPYACQAEDPSLANCPAGNPQSALAWAITPADPAAGVGEVVEKNGGIDGFSTQIELMPAQDLAVVVFANSRQNVPASGNSTAEAAQIARNVLYSIYYGLL